MPMKNPPHPGVFIRTEIIEPAGLSVTAAAAVLHVSRPALSSLLNAKADLSGEMALRIEKAFGREDGNAYADAVELRHRQDPQPRKGNQRRSALPPHNRGAPALAPASCLAKVPLPVLPSLFHLAQSNGNSSSCDGIRIVI